MAPKRKRATSTQQQQQQPSASADLSAAADLQRTLPHPDHLQHTPQDADTQQQQQQQNTTSHDTVQPTTQHNETHIGTQDQPTTQAAPRPHSEHKKHAYTAELRSLMFGYGDAPRPRAETVELLEDITLDYLRRVLRKAADAADERVRHAAARTGAQPPASARVRERDLLFVLRRDKRKLERVRELLEVWEEQKEARHGKAPEAYEKDDAEDDDPLAGV